MHTYIYIYIYIYIHIYILYTCGYIYIYIHICRYMATEFGSLQNALRIDCAITEHGTTCLSVRLPSLLYICMPFYTNTCTRHRGAHVVGVLGVAETKTITDNMVPHVSAFGRRRNCTYATNGELREWIA